MGVAQSGSPCASCSACVLYHPTSSRHEVKSGYWLPLLKSSSRAVVLRLARTCPSRALASSSRMRAAAFGSRGGASVFWSGVNCGPSKGGGVRRSEAGTVPAAPSTSLVWWTMLTPADLREAGVFMAVTCPLCGLRRWLVFSTIASSASLRSARYGWRRRSMTPPQKMLASDAPLASQRMSMSSRIWPRYCWRHSWALQSAHRMGGLAST
mmetsp:Transcript_2173/g.7092  ORF Transcript_2173/g.7092 Transcript_2173/m.7092 type:complete len:210 (-) Transcript_2173:1282-1911(-)